VAFGVDGLHEGPSWDDGEHEVDRWCRLVHAVLEAPVDPGDLLVTQPRDRDDDAPVVMHPGTSTSSKNWPATSFAALARALTADGRRVVVTGGPGEVSLAREVAGRAGL